jgi:hypothetical protein
MHARDTNDSAPVHQAEAGGANRTAPLLPRGELSIYTVAELRPAWLAWVAEWAGSDDGTAGTATDAGQRPTSSRPTLVGTAIDTVDAAGVQLLLALDHALVQGGHRLLVLEPSSALTSGCSALGLESWLAARSAPADRVH